jgi:hypothetical protein
MLGRGCSTPAGQPGKGLLEPLEAAACRLRGNIHRCDAASEYGFTGGTKAIPPEAFSGSQ